MSSLAHPHGVPAATGSAGSVGNSGSAFDCQSRLRVGATTTAITLSQSRVITSPEQPERVGFIDNTGMVAVYARCRRRLGEAARHLFPRLPSDLDAVPRRCQTRRGSLHVSPRQCWSVVSEGPVRTNAPSKNTRSVLSR